MSDTAVLVSGIIISAVSAVALAATFIICHIHKLKLNAKYDEEYGKPEKRGDGA